MTGREASMNGGMAKGVALLSFLKASAAIRRKRIATYGSGDKVLWFADVPKDRNECRSPFLTENAENLDFWLEVRKKRMPERPLLPEELQDWVREEELDQANQKPELLQEITVLVERRMPASDDGPHSARMVVEPVPQQRRLVDHPEVEVAWREYLARKWEPWAEQMLRWQEVQTVYEDLDFMRRRLEEAEERYELVLGVGFLQWRDPTGTVVQRHVLSAPAELEIDAARGEIRVAPAASFVGLRVELDMLDLEHRPRLKTEATEEHLEAIDVRAWDLELVAPLLTAIANSLSADAQVQERIDRAERVDQHVVISFAPAIVLRERRPTAYDELVRNFHAAAVADALRPTQPWERLLLEGEGSGGGGGGVPTPVEGSVRGSNGSERFLFPRPANEEQRQIVQRLRAAPCVLVKGPPGTGKSHTISNLICHLLASGDRVLVTAHAPKALTVLRDLLPDDVKDLCVTALGTSSEDQALLEESVRGILRRKNEWRGAEPAQREIDKAERELHEIEGEMARLERELRVSREAETHSHQLPGGYSGTAAQIARQLGNREQEFGWIPKLSRDAAFPLEPEESAFLLEAHRSFTESLREDLAREIGVAALPGPEEFQALVARLTVAEETAQRASRAVDGARSELLEAVETEALRRLRAAVQALSDLLLRASRILGPVSQRILEDLLASAEARWNRQAIESEALLIEGRHLLASIGSAKIELAEGFAEERVRADLERRLAHFEGGGRKGFSVFAPQVVRETRYLGKACQVDGKNAESVEQLRRVRDHLNLQRAVQKLRQVWGSSLADARDPQEALMRAGEQTAELQALLKFFQAEHAASLATVLASHRTTLASQEERTAWLKAIEALLTSRESRDAQHELAQLLEAIRATSQSSLAHPCMRALEDAVRNRDTQAWRAVWQDRERVRQATVRLTRYDAVLGRLDAGCAGLADVLRSSSGELAWESRVRQIREAWEWASARAWLKKVSDASAYEERLQDYHRLQKRHEKTTEILVARRAWKAFFDRLDEKTLQSLNAWTKAVQRIGKGTGVNAYRHRSTARQYLTDCVPRIPAWVMPLHRLWDSVEAQTGLFDTVIVDEASQASVDALMLFLLSKRIVVVGDEKQNSPEAVGVQEDDIARLAREHLSEFRFRAEFRPDTSLFDHAERTFGSHVTLREHFRCVPEIIRFSNDLCYSDAPLIPLRQAPPQRLPPLRSHFVAEGACEGEGQRIQNRAEAEALVETIAKLIKEDQYEGKTMGVIAMQGHSQAELIERLLAQRLDAQVIEQRRLRCGEPATFQGDQRDVIFLALVLAPNKRTRALTRLPDQRRFNVAMSRARDQVWLFHSVKSEDLAVDDLRRRLITFFENPEGSALDALFADLEHLEREARASRRLGSQPDPFDSWFEVDVALELLRRRFRVRPQFEVAGRRIDLVVEGLDARIAVECDGDRWHGPEHYEQDMARQRQLERAGWRFVRVRESEFYLDRQRAIQAVVEACAERGIRPVDFGDLSRPATSTTPREDVVIEPDSVVVGSVDSDELDHELPEGDASAEIAVPLSMVAGYGACPDPRLASSGDVREALLRIIDQEGPLTRESVYRVYVEGCPNLQRVGKVVRQLLSKDLNALIRAGEVAQEDELGPRSPEGQVVRIAGMPKVRVRPAGWRDLLDIPPSELLEVLRQKHPARIDPERDEDRICRLLLEHYELTRLTRPRKEYLSRVIKLAGVDRGGSELQ